MVSLYSKSIFFHTVPIRPWRLLCIFILILHSTKTKFLTIWNTVISHANPNKKLWDKNVCGLSCTAHFRVQWFLQETVCFFLKDSTGPCKQNALCSMRKESNFINNNNTISNAPYGQTFLWYISGNSGQCSTDSHLYVQKILSIHKVHISSLPWFTLIHPSVIKAYRRKHLFLNMRVYSLTRLLQLVVIVQMIIYSTRKCTKYRQIYLQTSCKKRKGKYTTPYSMVQSPSWDANWFVASQEISSVSWNPKVHYRTHKRPPPVYPGPAQSSPYTHIPSSGDPS